MCRAFLTGFGWTVAGCRQQRDRADAVAPSASPGALAYGLRSSSLVRALPTACRAKKDDRTHRGMHTANLLGAANRTPAATRRRQRPIRRSSFRLARRRTFLTCHAQLGRGWYCHAFDGTPAHLRTLWTPSTATRHAHRQPCRCHSVTSGDSTSIARRDIVDPCEVPARRVWNGEGGAEVMELGWGTKMKSKPFSWAQNNWDVFWPRKKA